jgi:hypothetical protein
MIISINQCWIIYILKRFIPGDENLDVFFLINVFENKSGCSIMDAAGFRVPTNQIRDFSTFKVSNV